MRLSHINLMPICCCERDIEGTMHTDFYGVSNLTLELCDCTESEKNALLSFIKGMEEGSKFKHKARVRKR